MITICDYTNPKITVSGGVQNPLASGQQFDWASSSCETIGNATTTIEIAGIESIALGIGFLVFLISFFVMQDIMNVKRYDR